MPRIAEMAVVNTIWQMIMQNNVPFLKYSKANSLCYAMKYTSIGSFKQKPPNKQGLHSKDFFYIILKKEDFA